MAYKISKDEVMVLKEFLLESEEHLDGIEEKVLKLEESKDIDLVNSIFRPIHTIKGTSSFLNLENIGRLSHEVETLLDDIRKERIQDIDEELIDLVLEAIDAVSKMLVNTSEAINSVDITGDVIETEIEPVEYEGIVERVIDMRRNRNPEFKESEDSKIDTAESNGQSEEDSLDYAAITFPREMKSQYEQEGDDHLNMIEELLLKLEGEPQNFDLYNDLFRSLHSIKGNTGVILSVIEDDSVRKAHFLNKFRELAHTAESIVQQKRDNKIPLSGDEIELLLRTTDFLKNNLADFKSNVASTLDYTLLFDELRNISSEADASRGEIKNIGGDSLAFAITNTLNQCYEAIEGGFEDIGDDKKRQKALKKMRRAYNTLIKVGSKVKHDLLISKSKSSLALVDFLLMGKDDNEEVFINDLKKEFAEIKKKGDRRKDEKHDRRKATIPPPPAKTKTMETSKAGDKVLKIAQEKIDVFMNLIGELLVGKNNLTSLAKSVSDLHGEEALAKRLKESADNIARISDELQSNIMEIRMLPVANAFSKFPRMIRDLSKKLNKKMRLEISGEETEIDKNIIEALSDPLVHMIRNSADHGIEKPADRIDMGKDEQGVIELKAFNQGQYVIIQITDDGAGIDPVRIRQKCLEKNLVDEAELERMDNHSLINMIFAPGFSMAKEVTDVSGRGVGMDVVKTNIEKLGGEVAIDSELGRGSVFTIKLPLTMAIGRGLEVSVSKNRYYIPLEFIVETLRVSVENIFTYKGKEMTVIREELIPVYNLEKQLGINSNSGNFQKNGRIALVIVNVKGQKLGVIVEEYYNEGEYVIKPLTGSMANIDGISGAMLTGEGKVHLILDLLKLF